MKIILILLLFVISSYTSAQDYTTGMDFPWFTPKWQVKNGLAKENKKTTSEIGKIVVQNPKSKKDEFKIYKKYYGFNKDNLLILVLTKYEFPKSMGKFEAVTMLKNKIVKNYGNPTEKKNQYFWYTDKLSILIEYNPDEFYINFSVGLKDENLDL